MRNVMECAPPNIASTDCIIATKIEYACVCLPFGISSALLYFMSKRNYSKLLLSVRARARCHGLAPVCVCQIMRFNHVSAHKAHVSRSC